MKTGPKPIDRAVRFARWYMPEPNSGCWLWLGAVNQTTPKYAQAIFGGLRAGRVSWEIHRGPIPTGMCICHRCDNPLCVNPDHLFLGTRKENQQDMQQKGRGSKAATALRGEAHGMAVLTEGVVKAIRASNGTVAHISKALGISYWSVWDVRHNRIWKHVT